MANNSVDLVPKIEVGTSSFNQLYLYGLATRHEVHHHLRTQTVGLSEKDKDKILNDWDTLQPELIKLKTDQANEPDSIALSAIPNDYTSQIMSYVNQPLFQHTFISSPISVEIVEIDKVIGGQRTVNLDHVDILAKEMPASPTMEQLLKICIAPNSTNTPIQHLEIGANVHMFSSPNTDLRFLGAFEKTIEPNDIIYAQSGGIPASALIMFVGYGISSINAFHINNRVILNNGFHRIYALRSKGITHIPMVLQNITNPMLEMPGFITGLQREYVCNDPRPVMIKDFFNSLLTIQIKAKHRIKIVTARAQSDQLDVPV